MNELDISPYELFHQNSSKLIDVTINGINTKVLELRDNHGEYLAIIATDKILSKICTQTILGHLIKEVSYDKYQDKIALIKAYY
ncbi:hypothetical protein PMY38_10050 [Clostridium tertium]|uniref:hypothetical protein n=1 Tax=Clostridium TaxID=1485 RepID=UPI000C08B8FF|nr:MULTISPECIES: hypothetical protein [Clostridium]MDB1935101.1 hypothetical protein [Clostridium tertium]MDB1938444.1 hypothetical protein [Clostridium tertium]MDB1955384.1 hypothetical protein [Clostridium tertium]MDB1958940.1 hypothetical protein [Clostridium tertium]MDB1963816.1 hypothetical protein [Clostridium tertium]